MLTNIWKRHSEKKCRSACVDSFAWISLWASVLLCELTCVPGRCKHPIIYIFLSLNTETFWPPWTLTIMQTAFLHCSEICFRSLNLKAAWKDLQPLEVGRCISDVLTNVILISMFFFFALLYFISAPEKISSLCLLINCVCLLFGGGQVAWSVFTGGLGGVRLKKMNRTEICKQLN